MKRRYDYRLIKSHRPYTRQTLAALYEVHPATVTRWINHEGLSVAIVCNSRPIILTGSKTKVWMKAYVTASKQPCAPDEMYCTRCKYPRRLAKGSFRISQSNTQKITAMGECIECGLTLRSFNVSANIEGLKCRFGAIPCE